MNNTILSFPEELNKFIKNPYDFSTLEIIFDEQMLNVQQSFNIEKTTRQGVYKIFIQKVAISGGRQRLIYHITDNPIGFFSFEQFCYTVSIPFKNRIVEPNPEIIENGFLEVDDSDSIILLFRVKQNKLKTIFEQNHLPVLVDLKFNKLKSINIYQDNDETSGFNRVARLSNS